MTLWLFDEQDLVPAMPLAPPVAAADRDFAVGMRRHGHRADSNCHVAAHPPGAPAQQSASVVGDEPIPDIACQRAGPGPLPRMKID